MADRIFNLVIIYRLPFWIEFVDWVVVIPCNHWRLRLSGFERMESILYMLIWDVSSWFKKVLRCCCSWWKIEISIWSNRGINISSWNKSNSQISSMAISWSLLSVNLSWSHRGFWSHGGRHRLISVSLRNLNFQILWFCLLASERKRLPYLNRLHLSRIYVEFLHAISHLWWNAWLQIAHTIFISNPWRS